MATIPLLLGTDDSTLMIPLTQGQIALIDATDAELVCQYRWCVYDNGHGRLYAVTRWGERRFNRHMTMHRLLLEAPPGAHVDHVDGDGLNNRRTNLRLATPAQNAANMKRHPRNAAGLKGVYWDATRQKWHAQIGCAGRMYNLGRYDDPVEAARAYDAAARLHFGKFARCNYPEESR